MTKQELCVIKAARRVADGYRPELGYITVALESDLLALRWSLRALDGGERRRLRDCGDECSCCPDHRYQD